jgi:RNA 3'-terminal phosphate cyclase (ATP)
VNIEPAGHLATLEIPERGELKQRYAKAIVCQLPEYIAKRELQMVQKMLNWDAGALTAVVSKESHGPGNVLIMEMEFEKVTEMFTGFGERGVSAEEVAKKACQQARDYLASGAPVGKYLADQLLLPLAMAGKGSFQTLSPSRHTMTNIEVIRTFLDINISCTSRDERRWQVVVG